MSGTVARGARGGGLSTSVKGPLLSLENQRGAHDNIGAPLAEALDDRFRSYTVF
jgi:hypothetical protein